MESRPLIACPVCRGAGRWHKKDGSICSLPDIFCRRSHEVCLICKGDRHIPEPLTDWRL